MKGRPPAQVGSITTTPSRIPGSLGLGPAARAADPSPRPRRDRHVLRSRAVRLPRTGRAAHPRPPDLPRRRRLDRPGDRARATPARPTSSWPEPSTPRTTTCSTSPRPTAPVTSPVPTTRRPTGARPACATSSRTSCSCSSTRTRTPPVAATRVPPDVHDDPRLPPGDHGGRRSPEPPARAARLDAHRRGRDHLDRLGFGLTVAPGARTRLLLRQYDDLGSTESPRDRGGRSALPVGDRPSMETELPELLRRRELVAPERSLHGADADDAGEPEALGP